jgi:protein phosphatase PTC2/3
MLSFPGLFQFVHLIIILTHTTATDKLTGSGANERVFYGLTSMQGWRTSKFGSCSCSIFCSSFTAMEDAHAVVLDLEAANDKQNCFFAVYDGHGGAPLSS